MQRIPYYGLCSWVLSLLMVSRIQPVSEDTIRNLPPGYLIKTFFTRCSQKRL